MLDKYVVVDLETTGLRAKDDKIIEIGAILVENGKEVKTFETFVNPGKLIPPIITQVTNITNEMVSNAPYMEDIVDDFMDFMGDYTLLGHNLMFDYSFIKKVAINGGYTFERKGLDTLKLARKYLEELESKKLDYLCSYFNIEDENHHRALNDARATYILYDILCNRYGAYIDEPIELNYKVKKENPITERQKKYLIDLITKHHITIDYDIDRLTKSEASRKIDLIIFEFGR
jgi:DNA polymerase III subunit epsilon